MLHETQLFLLLLNFHTIKKVFFHIFWFTPFSTLPIFLFSQPVPQAEIIIFGVIHNENEQRNAQLLLPIIRQLNPDIILVETDSFSNYFTADYQLRKPPLWYKPFLKAGFAKKMPPEDEVLYLLKKENKNLIFYPFDIAIKNRSKYVKSDKAFEKQFVEELNATNEKGGIPQFFEEQHKKLIDFSNYLFSFQESGYEHMNRPVVTDSIRDLMEQEYAYLPLLLDIAPTLKKYKVPYMERKAYWEERNQMMAENILFFLQKHEGKRILVLTGLLHKYILKDLLKPKEEMHSFKLKEWVH